MTGGHRTRILILGGGFAGTTAAQELARLTKGNPSVEVHLVSNENYFVFQPLLPEIVSCSIEPGHILSPIRQLCRGVHFHCASVTEVDRAAQCVTVAGSDERRRYTLHYDHLIWCLGLKMDLSQVPGMAAHALPIKTLGDAFHLRNHVIRRFEQAELEADERLCKKTMTFVAVGGGFSGVETIAAINDMAKSVLPFYPKAQAMGARIVLAHSGGRVLQELDPGLGQFAHAKLEERGVEIRLNTTVCEATAEGVTLSTGDTISAGTVVCTVGTAPHPLVSKSGLPQEGGRILVDEFMRIQGMDNLWAIGDAALIPNGAEGGYCPPTAQYAVREGRQCARNVLAAISGRRLRTFQFEGIGQLASVGRCCGVASVWGWKISGFLAWWLWRSVYLSKMPSLRCKVLVGMDWMLEALFPRDITMIEVQRTEKLERAHFRAGDTIVRQGEFADCFYIIESGVVEVIQHALGLGERRLCTRTAGDSFGELALVKDSRRTASVRCLTPVDVVVFTRADFHVLHRSYHLFRSHIDREVVRLAETAEQPVGSLEGKP